MELQKCRLERVVVGAQRGWEEFIHHVSIPVLVVLQQRFQCRAQFRFQGADPKIEIGEQRTLVNADLLLNHEEILVALGRIAHRRYPSEIVVVPARRELAKVGHRGFDPELR